MNYRFIVIAFLFITNSFAQITPCGSLVYDNFNNITSLPNTWTEYNTSGQVTIEEGRLKIDYTNDIPSVYRDFNPITDNFSYSFDVESTRNYVNCKMNLVSSTGLYLASLTFGLNGNRNILYARSLEAGIPSDYGGRLLPTIYNSNTKYSISLNVDYITQTIDFYNNGVLMMEDVSFLEAAQDVAKIDIQLISMYSNEGRFFFDNISLTRVEENRLLLTNSVGSAKALLSTIFIGDKCMQYPQSNVDDFQMAIDNANLLLADCGASSASIDLMLINLESAKDIFEASLVNDPVLKIYSAYDFSGDEYDIYCGYYNGDLGAYDDLAVSFTLEKGYMATFAQDINGLGVSKVYVAADERLRINLPINLQKNVSFIRVGPWKNVHKKGMSAKGTDVVEALDTSWHYNWGTEGLAIGDAEFVPNQWSGGTVERATSLGQRMDISHYMAFNEPDGANQANMTVDVAIERYEHMLASGLRLGSPANKDNAGGGNWRDEFMTKAEEKGFRVDFIVVHYYKRTTPTNFYNWLKAIHDKWKRPIWIKEFNFGATWISNKPATIQIASEGLQSYVNMLDAASFVERYSVFTWQPDQGVYSLMTVRNPVTLSVSGIMYRDHISPIAYTQELYEQGQQLTVGDNSNISKFLVFPTVVSNGVLNLRFSEAINNDAELTIYDTIGKEVKKRMGLTEKIDVSSLSNGLYLVKMKLGLKSFTQRIIIQ